MKFYHLFALSILSTQTLAAFSPETAYMAEKVKKNNYISSGIVSGGDALANPVTLANFRWASNSGFERVVIDLAGEGAGWESKVPPYFQVGVDSGKSKISISVRGVSKREVTSSAMSKHISRSTLFSKAYLAPAYEGDLASIELEANKQVEVEAFYLVSPPRIIIDVRSKK